MATVLSNQAIRPVLSEIPVKTLEQPQGNTGMGESVEKNLIKHPNPEVVLFSNRLEKKMDDFIKVQERELRNNRNQALKWTALAWLLPLILSYQGSFHIERVGRSGNYFRHSSIHFSDRNFPMPLPLISTFAFYWQGFTALKNHVQLSSLQKLKMWKKKELSQNGSSM
jgi:hypothetical protein